MTAKLSLFKPYFKVAYQTDQHFYKIRFLIQNCKKVSMVPTAQFLVPIWFLKIIGKFCQNAFSNWSNSLYIFLLPKKKDLLSAKFCNCYLYLHLGLCETEFFFWCRGCRKQLLTNMPVF